MASMIEYWRRKLRLGIVLLAASGLSQGDGSGQNRAQSPSDLILDATRRPPIIAGSCGEFYAAAERNKSDLESLVRFGAEAIPAVDAALDSIDEKGHDSEFDNIGSFLLIADARLKGAAAFPRLRQMRGHPRFAKDSALDYAAALSLGLTSYVRAVNFYKLLSNADVLRDLRRGGNEACSSPFRPEQALDFMILAWEKGDRALLKETLGPNARAGLDSLLQKDGTWDALRTRLWHITLTDKVAVGYLFDGPSSGSELFGTLPDWKPGQVEFYRGNRELDTIFKDGSGKDCGRSRIRFLSPALMIDNPDIEDLLSLISRCAANE
jgi:hypothetical protein